MACSLDFSIGPETERSFKHEEETLDPGRLDSNPIIPVEIPASRGARGDIHAHRSIDARALSRVEMAKSILESSNEEFPNGNGYSLLVPVYAIATSIPISTMIENNIFFF